MTHVVFSFFNSPVAINVEMMLKIRLGIRTEVPLKQAINPSFYFIYWLPGWLRDKKNDAFSSEQLTHLLKLGFMVYSTQTMAAFTLDAHFL